MTGEVSLLGGGFIRWLVCFRSPRGLASYGCGGCLVFSCFASLIVLRQLLYGDISNSEIFAFPPRFITLNITKRGVCPFNPYNGWSDGCSPPNQPDRVRGACTQLPPFEPCFRS